MTVVTLHYKLQLENAQGELVEETFGSEPLVFLYGAGKMIPEFEKNLSGKQPGEEFAFGIKAEDAYGVVNPDAIVELPLSSFMVDGEVATDLLVEGRTIPMSDNMGNRMLGVVKSVSNTGVVMDFNHPLAGKDLYFSGVIEAVRKATEEEVAHGHVHGPDGVEH